MSFTSIYNELRKEYPEVVSTSQIIKICHIGKRNATYLLQNNIIPCEDSGKKSRRYTEIVTKNRSRARSLLRNNK